MLMTFLADLRSRLQHTRAKRHLSPNERQRHLEAAPGRPGWMRIEVLGSVFTVPEHSWWPTFVGDWEAETLRSYRRFIRPGDTVVDVGTWIGPTLMFAAACGAARVLGIEPNPACLPYVRALVQHDPPLATRITHCATGVFARRGVAEFGIPKGELTARASASFLGRGTRINVAPLTELLVEHGFTEPDFIKIDVEGAEFSLADQLPTLGAIQDTRVLLSLHPPLALAEFGHKPLLEALQGFDLYDADHAPISHATVSERVLSSERMPPWGTEFGNFFEIVLVPRGQPLDRG